MRANFVSIMSLSRQDVEEFVRAALQPIKAEVTELKGEVVTLKHAVDVLTAKQRNSVKGRDDALESVPFPIGGQVFGDGLMPPTLAHLSINGGQVLPSSNVLNSWSARKSRDLLLSYGEASDSEGEVDESGPTARRRRIKLAQLIGITTAQLNSAKTIM